LRKLFQILNETSILNMDGTTSIDSLPMGPVDMQNNVQLNVKPMQAQQQQAQQQAQQQQVPKGQPPPSFDAKQLLSGLQAASSSGMTGLAIRDVPQNQEYLASDVEVRPNYIPSNEKGDYILNHQTSEEIVRENARRQQKTDSLDFIYEELQIPILIAVLYFLFQLPIVRKNMFLYLPSLFNKDGNTNLIGYIFNSLLFGGIYFLMTKTIKNFTI
jgi:hypothetical protein